MFFTRIRIYTAQLQWKQNVALTMLVLWGLFIVYGTMLPFDFSASAELIQWRLGRMWERPLRGLGGSWADVYSNIAFFMPWGFLLAIWRAGRGLHGWSTLVLAILSGACLSLSVEIVQLFAPNRSPSIVDLVSNTFGSVVGAVIGLLLARWIWPVASVRIRQLLLSRPVVACALSVAVGLLFAGLLPSQNNMGGRGLGTALESARLIPFGPSERGPAPAAKASLWGAELLVWTMVGGLFALASYEAGRHGVRAIILAVALAASLSLVIEVAQLVIPGRDVDLTSVVLAFVGSASGAALVVYLGAADARQWAAAAILIWGLAILLVMWNPPRFTWPVPPFPRPEMIVPFWSYFGSRSLEDLTDVVGQAMSFLPLGALLAARSWRQTFLSTLLIGFSFAAVLEFGQVFLPGRTADVSDAISAAAGAGMGLALWRWGESARTSSLGVTRYRVGTRTGRKA